MLLNRSFGGMEMDGSQSVAAWGINVGSRLAQGVSKIYSNFFSSSSTSSAGSSFASSAPSSFQNGHPNARSGSNPTSPGMQDRDKEGQKGVVTILDILRLVQSYEP